MSVTDKTRKILWARSGNRCSFCKCRLVLDSSELDAESVVGEECHIVSGAKNGPRYDAIFEEEKIDDLDNLILLCRIHHKLIDDQEETFSVDVLAALKKNHEKWVNERLDSAEEAKPIRIVRKSENAPEFLMYVLNEKFLVDHLMGAAGSFQDYPDDLNEQDLDLIVAFLQEVSDWIDLGINSPQDRIECQKAMRSYIKELDDSGLRVYVANEVLAVRGGASPPSEWRAIHVRIVKNDDPSQIQIHGS